MSIEDLKADLATNISQAKALGAMSTVGDVVAHLKNTMWPYIENVVGELDEQANDLLEMYHAQEDVLQAETGALFAAVIAGGFGLLGELSKRLTPADTAIAEGIKEWQRLATEAGEVLSEITIPSDDDGDESEDEDDDGDDDGDGNADDKEQT